MHVPHREWRDLPADPGQELGLKGFLLRIHIHIAMETPDSTHLSRPS